MSYTITKPWILGSSQAMLEVFSLLERIGDNDVTVLITGESGTGKELVAQALHQQSKRNKKFCLFKTACVGNGSCKYACTFFEYYPYHFW